MFHTLKCQSDSLHHTKNFRRICHQHDKSKPDLPTHQIVLSIAASLRRPVAMDAAIRKDVFVLALKQQAGCNLMKDDETM